MTLRSYFEESITGRRKGIDALFFRVIASCFSLMYIVAVRLRLSLYTRGVFRQESLPATVISVGNITVGGAGKTPVVAYLAGRFRENTQPVAILSRGYGRQSRDMRIIPAGPGNTPDWRQTGDEPVLLSRHVPDVPILIDSNRVRAGQKAIDTFGTRILLLDDGFQHLRLHRECDIVVIDAADPFGNGRVFPAGPMREPRGHLKRADLFWLTRTDQAGDLKALIHRLREIRPEASVLESIYRPTGLRHIASNREIDLAVLKGARTVLLCGIANPASFGRTAADLGADCVRTIARPDHYAWTAADIEAVQRTASEERASLILTTEKDGVKIPRTCADTVPIYELRIEVIITRGQDDLEKLLWNVTTT